VPHQTSPHVGQAANLHYTSVFVAGDTAQELAEGSLDSPQHALFKNPLEYKDGRIKVPTGPGLGLELDEAKLQAMRIRE
jgi:D-arabinonate dehydratase/D-galactarolactone cycloisomerase